MENTFKIRCSAIADIMVEPKEKNSILSVGCLTYVDQWMKESRWNRRKSFSSKYTEKGNLVEDDSLDMIMIALETGLIKKNTERKTDKWMTGECDIDNEREDRIIDAKNSWGLDSFPMYADQLPDKKYYGQGQGYCNLYNRSKLVIAYCLMDCPTFMIKDAIQKEYYNQVKSNPGIYDISYEDKIYIVHNMVFDKRAYGQVCHELKIDKDFSRFVEIPKDRRVKSFEFERDNEFIEKVKLRVETINDFLKNSKKYQQDFVYLTNKQKEKLNGITT